MNSILDNITHEERRVVQYVQLINGGCVCVKTTRDAEGKEYQYTALTRKAISHHQGKMNNDEPYD